MSLRLNSVIILPPHKIIYNAVNVEGIYWNPCATWCLTIHIVIVIIHL